MQYYMHLILTQCWTFHPFASTASHSKLRRGLPMILPLAVTFCPRASRRSAVGDVWLHIDMLTSL